MKCNLSTLAIGLLAAVVSSMAAAQATSTTTDHPTPIGTSQQTADLANQKAVQAGGTATVVRTGPSAADRLHSVTSSADGKPVRSKTHPKAKTKAAKSDDDTAAATSTTTAKP